ncbi:hypothetical protein ACIGO8_07930 [Streptomyces sp. NPDC053493]|uniref:hypothetical protein n=1 Tax=Streptomyces sp. NPDC053493 TaxID=3365705 RepID=UPI0037CF004A
MAIELPDELIQLEETAWVEIQARALTVDTAMAVQQGITELAEATGESRYDVEAALKKHVRHRELTAD